MTGSAIMGPLEWYHYINYEIADPRTNDWTLVRTPIPVTIITIAYLYFVLKCGPKYMENRPAYCFRKFMGIYNIFQIVSNAAIVYLIFDNGWYRDYFVYCTDNDMLSTPQNMQVGISILSAGKIYIKWTMESFCTILWMMLCLKIIDYIETGLFVLRKKNAQISFLHLYHHVSTVYITWLNMKYFGAPTIMTFGVVNCSVHVIMYTYYLLSTMGPKMQKLIHPVKRVITIIQMVQFGILIIHSLRAYYPGCPGLKVSAVIMVVNLGINFRLFYHFYRKNYTEKAKQK